MKLRELMTPEPRVVAPDAHLDEAAALMRQLDVGSLPVVEDGRLIGMITDRDITVRATAEDKNPDTATVRDAMTREVVSGFEDQDVREAAKLMEDKQVRRLPVLDKENRLVGIVALGDLAVSTGPKLSGEVLEKVSEPAEPDR